MYVEILTISLEGLSAAEREVLGPMLGEVCAAACNRLPGVVAHQWSVNRQTNTVSGIVRWGDSAAIERGTKALAAAVIVLHPDRLMLTHREIACPVQPHPVRRKSDIRPDTKFVHYPPDYDPRG